jgi:hypothetical protein
VEFIGGRLNPRAEGQTLEAILDEVATSEGELTREMVAFRLYVQAYLSRVSTDGLEETAGRTNHALMVRTIEHWRRPRKENVLYVTFNYDTVLDQALAGQYGWSPDSILSTYIADDRFQLFKLHGSCNWGQLTSYISPFGTGPTDGAGWTREYRTLILKLAAESAIGLTHYLRLLPGRLNRGQDWAAPIDSGGPYLMLPALAVPMRTKARFACPPEHVEELRRLLPQVDRIISIGWKAGEPDFLELLGSVQKNSRLVAINRTARSRRTVVENIGKVAGIIAEPDDETERPRAFADFARSGISSFLADTG